MTPWVVVPLSRPGRAVWVRQQVERQALAPRVCVVEVGCPGACVAIGWEPDRTVAAPPASSPGAARNLGLLALREETEPVAFFDDDDWYGSSYLDEAVSALSNRYRWVSKRIHFVRRLRDDRLYLLEPDKAKRQAREASGCTIVHYRAKDCPRFDPGLMVGEDTAWGLDRMRGLERGWATSIKHFCYSEHAGQTSRYDVRKAIRHRGIISLACGKWREGIIEGTERARPTPIGPQPDAGLVAGRSVG